MNSPKDSQLTANQQDQFPAALDQLSIRSVDALAVFRSYADTLGLVDFINQLIPTALDVSAGHVVLAMVLDTLSGRSPLYRLASSYAGRDIPALLGIDIPPEALNDDLVGRVLDRLFETGTQKIFTGVARRAVVAYGIKDRVLHFDTTSKVMYGDYEFAETAPPPIRIVHGYSKDRRPDLKQFIISTLCVGKKVPLFGRLEDGNANDKTLNNRLLTDIAAKLQAVGIKPQGFIYVADAAMVTPANLATFQDGEYFVTRLPATYAETERVIRDAVNTGVWEEVGALARTRPTKNRPAAHYRICEQEVVLSGATYRAVVVHSTAHDGRRRKRQEKELEREKQELLKGFAREVLPSYACRQDAEEAGRKWRRRPAVYHDLAFQVIAEPVYGRGRPPKAGSRPSQGETFRVEATMTPRADVLAELEQRAGCFVLLSNAPREGEFGLSSLKVLETYKDQFGVEQDFAFLKDDAIVNSIFLKKEERIEALGLILLLSLLIWRLVERDLERFVEQTGQTLDGWDKKRTDRPTGFMLSIKFAHVQVVRLGSLSKLLSPLSKAQLEWLAALNLTPSVFLGLANPQRGP